MLLSFGLGLEVLRSLLLEESLVEDLLIGMPLPARAFEGVGASRSPRSWNFALISVSDFRAKECFSCAVLAAVRGNPSPEILWARPFLFRFSSCNEDSLTPCFGCGDPVVVAAAFVAELRRSDLLKDGKDNGELRNLSKISCLSLCWLIVRCLDLSILEGVKCELRFWARMTESGPDRKRTRSGLRWRTGTCDESPPRSGRSSGAGRAAGACVMEGASGKIRLRMKGATTVCRA